MKDSELLEFARLFQGRGDVYGSNDGGCVKSPVSIEVLRNHFTTEPIGIYPLMAPGMVAWGCVDFDTTDARDHAKSLHDALATAGIVSWIERSRSKGYHVWVFVAGIVPANAMRNMLMVASQVANTPTTEVNPKQTVYNLNGYGNYVRLPYANLGDYETSKQRILSRGTMDVEDTVVSLGDFMSTALYSRNPLSDIYRIAEMYVAPVVHATTNVVDYDATLSEAMGVLSPLGKVIWRDGPLPGKDRSSTLAKLGHESVRSGCNASQTKVVLTTADKRWGKYHMRANGDIEIDKLVGRVHS